mmetsp:Transcript_73721/g.196165  ORF Transcript_73721/g.196165 Transcript_73721/m.196165 type:complete len:214 (+) Transcript_73721:1034-1675(+)
MATFVVSLRSGSCWRLSGGVERSARIASPYGRAGAEVAGTDLPKPPDRPNRPSKGFETSGITAILQHAAPAVPAFSFIPVAAACGAGVASLPAVPRPGFCRRPLTRSRAASAATCPRESRRFRATVGTCTYRQPQHEVQGQHLRRRSMLALFSSRSRPERRNGLRRPNGRSTKAAWTRALPQPALFARNAGLYPAAEARGGMGGEGWWGCAYP